MLKNCHLGPDFIIFFVYPYYTESETVLLHANCFVNNETSAPQWGHRERKSNTDEVPYSEHVRNVNKPAPGKARWGAKEARPSSLGHLGPLVSRGLRDVLAREGGKTGGWISPRLVPNLTLGFRVQNVGRPLHLAVGWRLQRGQIKLQLVRRCAVLIGRRRQGWV